MEKNKERQIKYSELKTYSSNGTSVQIGAEQTTQESSWVAETIDKPFNTDDIYRKVDGYDIYEEMGHDDQVNICMRLKKDLVLGSGFDFIPDADVDTDDDVVRGLENIFRDDLDVPFEDLLEEILTGYDFGFSITEKLFKQDKAAGMVGIKTLKTRHPGSFLIHTDKYGNIIKYEQVGRDSDNKINPSKIMHYVNNRRFQNPYGESDLRACYDAWFVKKHIIKYYAIFLESAAKPIPVAKYKPEAKEAAAKLFNVLKNFQAKTALVVPDIMDVEFLEAKGNGQAYREAINLFNMFIGRALNCPDLLGFQGAPSSSGGSQALGKTQVEIFFRHIARRRLTLEKMINKELVAPISAANWGILRDYPKFKFRPVTEDDAMEAAKLFLEAAKSRVYRPSPEEINHFRSLINFPEGDVDTPDPIEQNPFENQNNPNPKKVEKKKKENIDDDDMDSNPKGKEEKKTFAFEIPEGNEVMGRTDFGRIEKQLDSNLESITSQAGPVIDFMLEDLADQIKKKKILEGHPERIKDLKLRKLKDLNLILKKGLKSNYSESKKTAQMDLFKKEFAEPIIDQAFLDILDQETFDAIGAWEFEINKDTRLELVNAVKDGKSFPDTIGFLKETGEDIKTRLERYSRTKLTETMNKGRLAFFNESEVVQGYEYSAIMDDRTTLICSALHGKRFVKGTEPVPPLHFNCRSTLVPITIFETLEADNKIKIDKDLRSTANSSERKILSGKKSMNIDSFIEQTKGKGFSKQ